MKRMLIRRLCPVLLIVWLVAGSVLPAIAQDKHIPSSPGLAPVVPRDPVQAETEKVTRAASTARISLVQAVKVAQQHVTGNPIEATLAAEEGRPVYKVTIVDGKGKLQIVVIDGVEGKVVENPK